MNVGDKVVVIVAPGAEIYHIVPSDVAVPDAELRVRPGLIAGRVGRVVATSDPAIGREASYVVGLPGHDDPLIQVALPESQIMPL
jgi:hypothetical protein